MNEKIEQLFAKHPELVEVARHHLKTNNDHAYGFVLSHLSYKDPTIPYADVDKALRGPQMSDADIESQLMEKHKAGTLTELERWQLERLLSAKAVRTVGLFRS